MKNDHKVRFPFPPGFTSPEGIQPGDTFDVVCTIKPEADGMGCLVKLGDTPMPGYDEDDHNRDKPKPDYGEYARGIAGQMGQGQEQGAPPPQQGGY